MEISRHFILASNKLTVMKEVVMMLSMTMSTSGVTTNMKNTLNQATNQQQGLTSLNMESRARRQRTPQTVSRATSTVILSTV